MLVKIVKINKAIVAGTAATFPWYTDTAATSTLAADQKLWYSVPIPATLMAEVLALAGTNTKSGVLATAPPFAGTVITRSDNGGLIPFSIVSQRSFLATKTVINTGLLNETVDFWNVVGNNNFLGGFLSTVDANSNVGVAPFLSTIDPLTGGVKNVRICSLDESSAASTGTIQSPGSVVGASVFNGGYAGQFDTLFGVRSGVLAGHLLTTPVAANVGGGSANAAAAAAFLATLPGSLNISASFTTITEIDIDDNVLSQFTGTPVALWITTGIKSKGSTLRSYTYNDGTNSYQTVVGIEAIGARTANVVSHNLSAIVNGLTTTLAASSSDAGSYTDMAGAPVAGVGWVSENAAAISTSAVDANVLAFA